MAKQEIFILLLTFFVWFVTLKGRPFVGLIYYQLYIGLSLMRVYAQFDWLRIPFITAVLTFLSILLSRSKKILFVKQTWLLIALFGVMCISRFVNGLEVFGHKYMVFFYKIIFAHILIINLVDNKEKLKLFLWVLTIAGVVLAIVARYHDSEVAYYWNSKNGFARGLLAIIPFSLSFALSEKKWITKVEAACYFMIILLAMIGTNSRGAFLGTGVALILILITNFNVKRLVFSIIIVILVFSRVSSVHWERYDTIDFNIEQGGTGGQRIATWNTAIRTMMANPILGVGTGEYPNNFNRYATYDDQVKVGGVIGEETINTHNSTLQVGSENGFLGLGLYALIIFFCFWEMKRVLMICRGQPELEDLKQMTKAIGIAIIAFFVTAQLGNAGYSLAFYTLLSLSISSRIIAEREKEGVGKNLEEQMLLNIIPHQYQNIFRILLVVMFAYICVQA